MFVITSVTLKLSKNPVLNTKYGVLEQTINELGSELSVKAVSDAVTMIRQSKLPDPAEIGNAGSFFKNPVIDKIDYDTIIVIREEGRSGDEVNEEEDKIVLRPLLSIILTEVKQNTIKYNYLPLIVLCCQNPKFCMILFYDVLSSGNTCLNGWTSIRSKMPSIT